MLIKRRLRLIVRLKVIFHFLCIFQDGSCKIRQSGGRHDREQKVPWPVASANDRTSLLTVDIVSVYLEGHQADVNEAQRCRIRRHIERSAGGYPHPAE